jgi:hypothetical protein
MQDGPSRSRRVADGALRDAERDGRRVDALRIQGGEDLSEALAFDAEQILRRHEHVVEVHLTGVVAIDGEGLDLGRPDALGVARDDEHRDAVGLSFRRARQHHVELRRGRAADPHLGAVEHPAAVDRPGPGLHRAQDVGAPAGFGQAERRLALARGKRLEPPFLLRRAGVVLEEAADHELNDAEDRRRRGQVAEGAQRDQLLDVGASTATELLVDAQPPDAELRQHGVQAVVEPLGGVQPGDLLRRRRRRNRLDQGVFEQDLLFCEGWHGGSSQSGRISDPNELTTVRQVRHFV